MNTNGLSRASGDSRFTIIAAADVEQAKNAMRLVRQAKEVFPFLPGAVYEKALQSGELLLCHDARDQSLVGALHFHHRRDGITTVHEIVVAPRLRGWGIGRCLMNALYEAAQSHGQKKLRLKCPDDQPANGFYARVGFGRTAMEPSRKRHVAVWEMPVAPKIDASVSSDKLGWQFYASLTAGPSDIRRLVNRYYQGYADLGQEPPFHPFRRMIFTPLFSPPSTIKLFRELGSECPDPAITGINHALPRPTIMCDSGGYQVQMGKMTFDELAHRLRGLYEKEDWADYYVLPDHVPHSTDTVNQVSSKVSETLSTGELFLSRFPQRREKFMGVVHGRTEAQVRAGAAHWADLGIRYIGFGSFGTSGPNGSVNLVSNESTALLATLSDAARENGQGIHVFGIGGPEQLRRFEGAKIQLRTYDSANWWKMAGFGYVLGQQRTFRVSQTHRQVHTVRDLEAAFALDNHQCPYCACRECLRTNRYNRILHNLSAFLQGVDRFGNA